MVSSYDSASRKSRAAASRRRYLQFLVFLVEAASNVNIVAVLLIAQKGLSLEVRTWTKIDLTTVPYLLDHHACCSSNRGVDNQVELCKAANIPGFPTWEIDGKLYPGEQTLEELEEIVGLDPFKG